MRWGGVAEAEAVAAAEEEDDELEEDDDEEEEEEVEGGWMEMEPMMKGLAVPSKGTTRCC